MLDVHDGGTYIDMALGALRRRPEATAFVQADRRISYAEALATVETMAAALWSAGLRPGEGAAILAGNMPEAFLFYLAVLRLGARYSALHPLGAVDDLAFIVGDVEARVLVYDPRVFAERARDIAAKNPGVRLLSLGPAPGADDLIALAGRATTPAPAVVARAADIAQIAYTGGTTGRPKGVVHTQRSMGFNCAAGVYEYPWPPHPKFLACTPITHAAGMMIVPVWMREGTVYLLPGFDPAAMLAAIETWRVDSTLMVPTMVYALLQHPKLATSDVSSLRFILYGAAPMSEARLRQAIERFGPVFMQGYGQTEALNNVILLKPEDHDRPERLAAAGRGVLGLDVRVLGDDDQPVAPGTIGEICVRGPSVMNEYWRQPELTAEVLRNGWLRTGDMATVDGEGFITIVDRKKDMIVSGGFNVYPREIEEVLLTHPAVAMAAVIGVPDDYWGEAVKAVVTLRPGATVEPSALVAHVRERKGPLYAPKSLDVVEGLPLTVIGKVDKKALRAPYWASSSRQVH